MPNGFLLLIHGIVKHWILGFQFGRGYSCGADEYRRIILNPGDHIARAKQNFDYAKNQEEKPDTALKEILLFALIIHGLNSFLWNSRPQQVYISFRKKAGRVRSRLKAIMPAMIKYIAVIPSPGMKRISAAKPITRIHDVYQAHLSPRRKGIANTTVAYKL